jgi:hypothetical protein
MEMTKAVVLIATAVFVAITIDSVATNLSESQQAELQATKKALQEEKELNKWLMEKIVKEVENGNASRRSNHVP